MAEDAERRGRFAVDEHLRRGPVRIARHLCDHVIEGADVVVIHLVAQCAGLAVDEQIGMHAFVRIARVLAMKKPRDAIALQAAEADSLSHHVVHAAD